MPLLLDQSGLVLCASCLVLGAGLASGGPPWLAIGERLVVGIVLAVVALTVAGYLVALVLGISTGLILVLALAGLAAGGVLLWRHLPRLRRELTNIRQEFVPADLALPLAVLAIAAAMGYLFARAVEVTPEAWLSHYNNTWSDWSFHASYATTFVYGHNLPPQNPIYAGTPFRYPFAPDFLSALLIAGGFSLPAALAWPSWAMTVLALSGLILWGRRLSGALAPGMIAVSLTLLGGGVGFLYFFGDASRLGLRNALAHIPQTYDRIDPPVNIQWYNPILSYYLPQRSFVFGAAILLAVLLLITPPLLATPAWRWRETLAAIKAGWRRPVLTSEAIAFPVAGALAGLLPWFHVHSLAVIGLVTLCWALLYPRPAWLGFFGLTAVLALPRLLMAVQGDKTIAALSPSYAYPQWMAGWMSAYDTVVNGQLVHGYDVPPWFWLKNTGLFWPLLLVALLSPLALKGRGRLLIAPFSLVFLIANVIKFQPWNWDNSKLLVFWYMASAVAVGAMLVRIWRMRLVGPLLASVAWLTLIASGALSLLQFLPPQGPSYGWFSAEDLQVAAQVRQLTPPRAVFVTGEQPNNAIADLAGRSVLMSYPGWLWSYGINYARREADLGCPASGSCPQGPGIYDGGEKALALLHHYHVDYLVIGPAEMASFRPNLSYFASSFELVLRTTNYLVYKVPG